MSTIKHFIIRAAFALAGSVIAAQVWAATEANDNSGASQPKSGFTISARPNASEIITVTGLIGDVHAFYAERGRRARAVAQQAAEMISHEHDPLNGSAA